MTDSNPSERLDAKHERNERERLERIRRWVEYIQDQPPEVWGTQQNRLVDEQLKSARETGLSADHERRGRAFAEDASSGGHDDETS